MLVGGDPNGIAGYNTSRRDGTSTGKPTIQQPRGFNAVRQAARPSDNDTSCLNEDFTAQFPMEDGIGEFHVNHFVGRFRRDLPSGFNPDFRPSEYDNVNRSRAARYQNDFHENFCEIFTGGQGLETNIAMARPGTSRGRRACYVGLPTVEFTFHAPLEVHSDWVVMTPPSGGSPFHGTTIRRNWTTSNDLKLAGGIVAAGSVLAGALPVLGPVAAVEGLRSISVNQSHFLAGRRSWRLWFQPDEAYFYVETATIERNSRLEYMVLERSNLMRAWVDQLWRTLLRNVASYFGTQLDVNIGLKPDYAGYVADQHGTLSRHYSFESVDQVISSDWFGKVLPSHPGLVEISKFGAKL